MHILGGDSETSIGPGTCKLSSFFPTSQILCICSLVGLFVTGGDSNQLFSIKLEYTCFSTASLQPYGSKEEDG